MHLRRFSILTGCGLILAIAFTGCTQTEGKIIPPAPNTLPEGAKLTVMGAGGAGSQKIQGPGIAKAAPTKPDETKKGDEKKEDGKKDDKPAGDEKKPAGDGKKPTDDANKDKPKS